MLFNLFLSANHPATSSRRAAVGRMLASGSECMTHRDDAPAPGAPGAPVAGRPHDPGPAPTALLLNRGVMPGQCSISDAFVPQLSGTQELRFEKRSLGLPTLNGHHVSNNDLKRVK